MSNDLRDTTRIAMYTLSGVKVSVTNS